MSLNLHKHLVWISFLTLCFLTGNATSVSACSCMRKPTVLEAFDGSDTVLIARLISVEKASDDEEDQYVDGVRSATMVVERVFKGNVKVRDVLVFAQGGGADCIWTFNEEYIGSEILFYLRSPDDDDKLWYASICGRSNSVKGAIEDLPYLENMAKLRGKTRISGIVGGWRNPDMDVAGKKIRIIGAKKTYVTKTNDDGFFEIYDLPPGKYLLEPEIPVGWKLDLYSLRYSLRVPEGEEPKSTKQIPLLLEAKKHVSVNIAFEIDNVVRGKVFGPDGKPMPHVCLALLLKEGQGEKEVEGGSDCTDPQGKFEITSIPRGEYVLVANMDGKLSSSEPFRTIYYPNVAEKERAAVISIGPGETVGDINIFVPKLEETITLEGVLSYSDGTPVADDWVSFKSTESDGISGDVNEKTDAKGRFRIKILKGVQGKLSADEFVYIGEYTNCSKLDDVIRKTGETNATLVTNVIEIQGEQDVYDLELTFPFPGCTKARTPD